MAVRSPIQTSRPSSMWARPRRHTISADRAMLTLPCVLMCRLRIRSRHRYRKRYPRSRPSSPKRLLAIQEEVVEHALGQHAVQVALVQAVEPKVRVVGEPAPPLAEQAGTHSRFHRADRPPNEGGHELLRLGPNVDEPDVAARSLHGRRIERVEVDG